MIKFTWGCLKFWWFGVCTSFSEPRYSYWGYLTLEGSREERLLKNLERKLDE